MDSSASTYPNESVNTWNIPPWQPHMFYAHAVGSESLFYRNYIYKCPSLIVKHEVCPSTVQWSSSINQHNLSHITMGQDGLHFSHMFTYCLGTEVLSMMFYYVYILFHLLRFEYGYKQVIESYYI